MLTAPASWGAPTTRAGAGVSTCQQVATIHTSVIPLSHVSHARLNFSRHRRPRITLDPVKLRKRPKASADDYIEGKKTLRTELGRCRDEFILEHFRKYDSPEFPPLRKPLEVTSYGNNSFIFYPFLLYNVKKT